MRLNLIPVLAALLLSGCVPVQTTVNPTQLPAATDYGAHANPMAITGRTRTRWSGGT